ncbi:uncharacterized protein RCO7_14951 [Rhynchosporium graminicola]|uniref:Uncharacterized protein n=1 Tax=Rhynchosporium graminicola TaxID=2792576 RepID=A0A1E1LC13_9HELO|nr:uncharacterized protein RCO7_14951 [Rhynchosporium commune]
MDRSVIDLLNSIQVLIGEQYDYSEVGFNSKTVLNLRLDADSNPDTDTGSR